MTSRSCSGSLPAKTARALPQSPNIKEKRVDVEGPAVVSLAKVFEV